MSQAMPFESPRTSVFTFQSSVHSSHVLRCLDEQRRKEVLCDVTVVVENRSYRAHRSVLASCSDYFHNTVASHAGQGLVLTLPEEVTVEGFDPLLQFAYTSKLLFTKENIVEIHNCAAILGFHNLDKACFDFLIPKFFDSGKSVLEILRKVCCKSKCNRKQSSRENSRGNLDEGGDRGERASDKPSGAIPENGSDGTQSQCSTSTSECPQACGPNCSEKHVQTDYSLLCPKYRKYQIACGKDRFCLEGCGPQASPFPPALDSGACVYPCLPSVSHENDNGAGNLCAGNLSEKGTVPENEVTPLAGCLPCIPATPESSTTSGFGATSDLSCDQPAGPPGGAPDSCPLDPTDVTMAMVGDEDLGCGGKGATVDFGPSDSSPSSLILVEGGDRSSVEREVAEHLTRGFWPDPCPSQAEALLLDPDGQTALGKATDFHWLKQLDLTASTGDCPFLRDLAEEVQLPECEGVSQQEKSPYISSINSGDDSDSDTDGDSESYNRERAREVQLPFPVEQISSLSRNDFQHVLKLHSLTREQLDFVHDVRRRSKNRVAAQRCRKRKLDCISGLEGEVHKLRGEKEKLMQEREQLKRCKGETLQSLSTLCHKVCSEATLSPDQLEFLAQYSSPDCPASVLMAPTPSPGLGLDLGLRDQDLPAGLSQDACPTEDPSTDEAHPSPSASALPPLLLRTADCPAPELSSPSSTTDVCSGANTLCPTNEGSDSSPPVSFFLSK